MKLWSVMLLFVAAFTFACGSGGSDTDEGGEPDSVVADIPAEDVNEPVDTAMPDVGNETIVGQDTNEPEDEGQGVDTNVPKDEGGTDTKPTCPTGIATGPTCLEAAACAVLCDDATFEASCLGQADQTAQDAWTALKACAGTAECAMIFEGEQVSGCVAGACQTEVAACLVGELDCRDMWTCRKDCPVEDPTCPMKCIAAGTAEAQAQWIEYKNCILDIECSSTDVMENGWPTFNCEQYARGFCSLPYQGCFPPT